VYGVRIISGGGYDALSEGRRKGARSKWHERTVGNDKARAFNHQGRRLPDSEEGSKKDNAPSLRMLRDPVPLCEKSASDKGGIVHG